ncbi:MAG TPA: endopeptidase La [Phycisphaerae bacterium]|nr:endopeptidase La [Phycisphaerae bacterium]
MNHRPDADSLEARNAEVRAEESDGGDDIQEVELGAPGSDELPEIPPTLPMLPVRDRVAFPGTVMPLNVAREKSKKVLDLALAADKLIAVVAQRVADTEDPHLDDLYRIGTACRILKMLKLPDGSETIIVHGLARVGVEELVREAPYLEAKVHHQVDEPETSVELEALVHNVRHAADRVMELSPNVPEEAKLVIDNISTAGGLADFLAANLSLSLVYRQELLETFDVKDRLRKVYAALSSQLEVLELSQQLRDRVRDQMDKSQREYYLREQLKAIQSELGQSDARSEVVDRLGKEIAEAKLPPEAQAAADRELERLAMLPQASPEYSVAVDYVEWLSSLPWAKATADNLDLTRAEHVLEADHYGLKKIKRRILESLAVRKLNPSGRGTILCFAGPPGTGKTSLGRSIARALGRNFIRMSLGGVRDEAEIRGHRRTYVGAMPGRVIQEIRKCGSNNPVFMLDEVDKVGTDFRGDPASALLEVLDPQQNDTFTDHYLDVPFDLSHVFFIATANYMDMVPSALRDRMEVIMLSSYTHREKLEIARQYLVPRQLVDTGLRADCVTFTDEALTEIITGYTREAGVRELERRIGAVCRALAAATVRGESACRRVTPELVAELLGPVEYISEIAARVGLPGVVTGLAYTIAGGEILFIEASRMPGSGQLAFTGQIGDVMRESGHAAFSLIRSRARKLRISQDEIVRSDIHVHIPAGAVPKDGPSAGLALVTALISAYKDKAIDPRTAMTGEITLRGAVLPVGGIKEKVLAAHRAGIRRVYLPAPNIKDLEEVPAEVRDEINFIPVKTIDDVVPGVFQPARKPRKSARNTRARDEESQSPAKSKRTSPRRKRTTKKTAKKSTTRKKKTKRAKKTTRKKATRPAARRKSPARKKGRRAKAAARKSARSA